VIAVLLARLFPGNSWQSTATEAEERPRRRVVAARRFRHRPAVPLDASAERRFLRLVAARQAYDGSPEALDGHAKGAQP
jgi:hypothetical protein